MATPKIAVVLIVSVLATSCIYIDSDDAHHDWEKAQRANRAIISELRIDTLRADVLQKLGSPERSEAYTKNGQEYRILFYRTHRTHADGKTTWDEMTPLVFENDRLIGWGNSVLDTMR